MPSPLSRIQFLVRQPFQGLDRSVGTEDLVQQGASVASNVQFEQGYLHKRAGRSAVGGTDSVPLNGAISGLFSYRKLDSTQRIIAFTNDRFYWWEPGAATWTNATGSIALQNTLPSAVTYVNTMYFVTGHNTSDIYSWSGTGNIAATSATYPGKILAVYGERLLVLNTWEGSAWQGQRVRWSNVGNTTFSSNDFIDLVSFLGDDEIIGCAHLQSSLIIYGRRHILECSYTGSTVLPFAFSVKDAEVGLASARSLHSELSAHYFLSNDGIYSFDLSLTAKPIDLKVRDWFRDNCNLGNYTQFCMTKDQDRDELILYYMNSGSSANDRFLSMNTRSGVWTEGTRSCTATCIGGPVGQLTIDSLSGTIDSQSGSIDNLGAPSAALKTFVGDANGTVWQDWTGTDLGASAVELDYETKDFCSEEDEGLCWMGIEFFAKGDSTSLTVSYSTDRGTTWTALSAVTLSNSWTRYRKDFEAIGKTLRFKFANTTLGQDVYLMWYRPYFLKTTPWGTLPT